MFVLAVIQAQLARNEEDLRLMHRIIESDQAALSELYDRYASLIYTLALRIVKGTAEAEDLVQEVFLQVWKKAKLFAESKGSVYTWIVTIARRKAIDRLRLSENVNRGISVDEDAVLQLPDIAHDTNPLNATISSEYEQLMREGLGQLTQEQRILIEMSFYEGYTQQQLSDKLKIPLGTVKTRMRQGLMKLRQHVREKVA